MNSAMAAPRGISTATPGHRRRRSSRAPTTLPIIGKSPQTVEAQRIEIGRSGIGYRILHADTAEQFRFLHRQAISKRRVLLSIRAMTSRRRGRRRKITRTIVNQGVGDLKPG